MPDWTFAATANAVHHAGAIPLFVDVDPKTWTLDADLVAEILEDRRIAAVIAVHALGHPADMDPLIAHCRKAGVVLIEDAAGAVGSRYKGRPAGGLAEIAAFSFNGNKVVTAGGGGMVVTDREDWGVRISHLSTQARTGADYRHDAVGFNYRMTNLNAAVGIAQLERLDVILAARAENAAVYDAALAGRDDLAPMPRAPWALTNNSLCSVRCAGESDAASLVNHLLKARIQARPFWHSLAMQQAFADAPSRLRGISAGLSGTVVSLPSSSNLTDGERARVVAALAAWRGRQVTCL